jgi:hypothetical protein
VMERTNYPTLITVHRSAGVDSGTDVYVGTECKEDYSDLRFALTDMATLLPYWVEHNTITSASAKVWVNIPSIISDSSVSYYMLFGNSFAVDMSDGDATFTFFEDFLGSAIDNTKWRLDASGTQLTRVSNSILSLGLQARLGALASYKYGTGFAFGFNGYSTVERDGGSQIFWFGGAFSSSELNADSLDKVFIQDWADTKSFQTVKNSTATSHSRATTISDFATIELRRYSNSCEYWLNDGYVDTITTNIPLLNCGFVFTDGDTGGGGVISKYTYVDWCRVRKVACTEPTFGTWGVEE